jgi:two-component sensor histidine kinase
MPKRDPHLDRLLRAAAQHDDAAPAEMPYGFDTRVVALARAHRLASGDTSAWEIARLVRRIAVGAVIITAIASSAAYWQVSQNQDLTEPSSNAYAIADNAIETEFFQ